MSTRISVDRDTVDRMILTEMDVDRYQTQVIPDLQQRVADLSSALRDLVGAVRAAQQNKALARLVEDASSRAQRVLDAGYPDTKGARP